MLAALYFDVNAAETTVHDGKPAVSNYVLEILGTLREPLSEDEQVQFDALLDTLIVANMNARHNP